MVPTVLVVLVTVWVTVSVKLPTGLFEDVEGELFEGDEFEGSEVTEPTDCVTPWVTPCVRSPRPPSRPPSACAESAGTNLVAARIRKKTVPIRARRKDHNSRCYKNGTRDGDFSQE